MLQGVNNNKKNHTPTYFYMIDIIWNWNLTIWPQAVSLSYYSRHAGSRHFKASSCHFNTLHTYIRTYTHTYIYTYIRARKCFNLPPWINFSLHFCTFCYAAINNTPQHKWTLDCSM
jgi:hypothetical protein